MSFFGFGRSRAAPAVEAKVVKEAPAPLEHSPLTVPLPGVKVEGREYSAEQNKLIKELQEYTKSILLPETDVYYAWECRFLADPGTHPRYLRAAKWNLADAKKRIKATMEWRREYRPELIEPAEISPEQETGKQFVSGFDKAGRPLVYMYPARQNTDASPRQIRHVVWTLERAIDLMPPNQEQVSLVIDYSNANRDHQVSMSTGRQVLSVLQNHYVERLGRAYVLNVPWYINAFFTAISPFVDPVSREKIRFNPNLVEFVEAEQLDIAVGGAYNFEYKHDVYWPELNTFCRITPEGKRIDQAGEDWVPPAGNGIKHALDMKNGQNPATTEKVPEPVTTV